MSVEQQRQKFEETIERQEAYLNQVMNEMQLQTMEVQKLNEMIDETDIELVQTKQMFREHERIKREKIVEEERKKLIDEEIGKTQVQTSDDYQNARTESNPIGINGSLVS